MMAVMWTDEYDDILRGFLQDLIADGKQFCIEEVHGKMGGPSMFNIRKQLTMLATSNNISLKNVNAKDPQTLISVKEIAKSSEATKKSRPTLIEKKSSTMKKYVGRCISTDMEGEEVHINLSVMARDSEHAVTQLHDQYKGVKKVLEALPQEEFHRPSGGGGRLTSSYRSNAWTGSSMTVRAGRMRTGY